MLDGLSGKVLFVTGAARGLGKAIAKRFLQDGACVSAFDNHRTNLEAAVKEWKGDHRVLSYVGDVRRRDEIQIAIDNSVERYGRIDVLANVAGVAQEDEFLDITPESWQRIIDVNLTGVFNVAQIVARQMVTQPSGGCIINMASKNGIAAEV